MTKLTLEANESEILALSDKVEGEIKPMLRTIDELMDQITDKMHEFYDKLEDPQQTYYELGIYSPYINGKTFGFTDWNDEPYWVSSSEQC